MALASAPVIRLDEGAPKSLSPKVQQHLASMANRTEAAASSRGRRTYRKSASVEEIDRVRELPDLMGKLDEMGMTEEYVAYRERYLAWRTGDAHGASGEVGHAQPGVHRNQGFGFWYPSLEVWQWRRTLSYWIAVTFFEGSIFFTLSSFLWCYAEDLGRMKEALTKWGYVGGKINFIVCTYLMCIETINLTADHEEQRRRTIDKLTAQSLSSSSEDESSTTRDHHDVEENSDYSDGPGWECLGEGVETRRRDANQAERFYLNPFRAQKALRNLKRLGSGPWPYWASLIYLLGVMSFTVGLVAEFCTFLPHSVEKWTLLCLGEVIHVPNRPKPRSGLGLDRKS
ncbi:unnamed protein product [Symbiodinium natans]|uniref:Uncharacterized protein n=1 Tax=Symbiodinium natans TaxID=878477 RepID=A0A812TCD0_9DINO|nr:unnamed protein product [Symbiodinium natans]